MADSLQSSDSSNKPITDTTRTTHAGNNIAALNVTTRSDIKVVATVGTGTPADRTQATKSKDSSSSQPANSTGGTSSSGSVVTSSNVFVTCTNVAATAVNDAGRTVERLWIVKLSTGTPFALNRIHFNPKFDGNHSTDDIVLKPDETLATYDSQNQSVDIFSGELIDYEVNDAFSPGSMCRLHYQEPDKREQIVLRRHLLGVEKAETYTVVMRDEFGYFLDIFDHAQFIMTSCHGRSRLQAMTIGNTGKPTTAFPSFRTSVDRLKHLLDNYDHHTSTERRVLIHELTEDLDKCTTWNFSGE